MKINEDQIKIGDQTEKPVEQKENTRSESPALWMWPPDHIQSADP